MVCFACTLYCKACVTSAAVTLSQSVTIKQKFCVYLCEDVTIQTLFGLTGEQITLHFKVFIHALCLCMCGNWTEALSHTHKSSNVVNTNTSLHSICIEGCSKTLSLIFCPFEAVEGSAD